jgi:hypothetical protein
MALQRRALIAKLAEIIDEITAIKTVVRTYTDVDMTLYNEVDLPLADIVEPAEEVFENESTQRSMMSLPLRMRVLFITWGVVPSSTYESLVKAIRDKIGEHFTLDQTATKCQVNSVSGIGGEMPLYYFDVMLETRYHLNEKET